MFIALALGLISILCLIAFLYPYLIYPLCLDRMTKRPVHPAPKQCSVSLLFCAFNEAQSLPEKIENLRLLKAGRPDLQILVYDDSSTDGTAELLASAGDLLTVIKGGGRTGKAAGMKRLAAIATGEILVFTDANVILAPDAIDRLLPYYGDPEVGGVCGTLLYSNDPGSTIAEVGTAYWRLDEKLRSLESETGDVMGADGSIFSTRRSLYPQFPETVLDDFTVSMNTIFAGYRLIKAADVLAYEKSVSKRDEEMRRKIRIGARAMHTHLYLRPQVRRMSLANRFKYTSRKIMRWYGGTFLCLSGIFALAAILAVSFHAFLVCSLAGLGIIAVSLLSHRGIFAKIGDILLATLATQIGVLRGLRGVTVVTWSPAKSR